MTRLEQQMQFALEVDKLKYITRQTYLSKGDRKENDAEHSWHLAMLAMLLSEHSEEPVDVLKVMKMVIIHDIVEIDAGDTYCYDDAGNATKRERETAAADRIFGILPKDQAEELRNLWEEFEEAQTPEAAFAHSLDRIQPVMLNDATHGVSWKEHQVKRSQIEKRIAPIAKGSKSIKAMAEDIVEKNVKLGNIIDE